jgi:hypothetical protein
LDGRLERLSAQNKLSYDEIVARLLINAAAQKLKLGEGVDLYADLVPRTVTLSSEINSSLTNIAKQESRSPNDTAVLLLQSASGHAGTVPSGGLGPMLLEPTSYKYSKKSQ